MILPRIARNSSRNEYKFGQRCLKCNHRATRSCACSYCRNLHKNTLQHLSAKLPKIGGIENSNTSQRPINAADLTLKQAVSLISLIKCYGISVNKYGMPSGLTKKSSAPFSPSGNYGEEALSCLIDAGLLHISENTHPKSYSLQANPIEISLSAQWRLPKSITTELIINIENLIINNNWPIPWYEQVSELASDLAFSECREFYEFCANERRFSNANENSISALIRNLLEDFSTGQCFRIIYSGAQYAADFLVKQAATPQHAANYMVGACERWADKARAENWVVTAFRRNLNCPRSMMSHVLYDFILKSSDDGLNTPIALIRLPTNTKRI